jgi:hypothetical protein
MAKRPVEQQYLYGLHGRENDSVESLAHRETSEIQFL